MSNHYVPRRALAAIIVAVLAAPVAPLACASGRAKARTPAPSGSESDTAAVTDGGGKTIENLFAGRFPGVSVVRTDGGGLQIRIRGGSGSFYASEEPLYLVDDTPLPQGTGGIVFLNPYDIETIEVLKNPADVGLYGIRGANGVVKITTKRPGKR